MLDHITFSVTDFERSAAFYDRALAPLGVRRLFDDSEGPGKALGYGDDRPWFWITDGAPTSGPLPLARRADSRAAVEAFHREALLAGGTDHGAPGLRPQYEPGYYAAFILDPDGHNTEAVIREPSTA